MINSTNCTNCTNCTNYANYYAYCINYTYTLIEYLFNKLERFVFEHEKYIHYLTDQTIIIIKSMTFKKEIIFVILYLTSIHIISFTISYTCHILYPKLINVYNYCSVKYVDESIDQNSAESSVNGNNNYAESINNNLENDLLIRINKHDNYQNRCVMKVRRSTRNKHQE